MSGLPAVLDVEDLGEGRWTAPHPIDDPEGRDVVFSGQMLAQMIMVSDAAGGHQKEVKSVHAVFARAGTYSGGRIEYVLDPMHSGRAWASDTITAYQGDRLLARALVLLNAVEPDLMRHAPQMPDVPGPEACAPQSFGMAFPGVEVRAVERPDAVGPSGTPAAYFWVRSPRVVRLGRGQPGGGRLVRAGVDHRRGDGRAHRHRRLRAGAPLDLDRRDLPHRALPRPRRRGRLAPLRARGSLRGARARLRDRLGVHA